MQSRGFTLLEVLIAVSIFSFIGLASYRLLTTIVDTHDRVRTVADNMTELGQAMAVIERDLYQVTPRSVRDEYGEPLPALMVGTGQFLLELTRSGWSNPAQLPRSQLQRVAYDINAEGELVRYFWIVLDRAEDSVPIEQVLLRQVDDLRVNLLDADGESVDSWPTSTGALLPKAIEVVIATQRVGEVRRLLPTVNNPAVVTGPVES